MKKLLLNNYNIKLMSVLVAVLLWWFVYSEHNPQFRKELTVPLSYVNIDDTLSKVSGPEVARIKFRGDTDILNQVSEKNVKAVVDLKGIKAGMHNQQVNIVNTTGARVIGRDLSVNFELKRLNKIELPVNLHFYGMLPIGLKLGEVGRPVSASVYGTPETLAMISQVAVSVDLTERKKSFVEKANLQALDRSGVALDGLNISPAKIDVKIPVVKESEITVKVSLRYRAAEASDRERYMDFFPKTVTLYGNKYALEKIMTVSTEEFDADRCRGGGYFSLKLEYPDNVVPTIERVTLSCEAPKEISRSFIVDVGVVRLCKRCVCEGCEKRNDAMGYDVVVPSGVEVFVIGPGSSVNAISIADISAMVDLSTLGPGTHEVKPEVKLKDEEPGVKINIEPATLRMMIRKGED